MLYAIHLRQLIGRFYHIILNTKTIRYKSSFLEKSYPYDVQIDTFDVKRFDSSWVNKALRSVRFILSIALGQLMLQSAGLPCGRLRVQAPDRTNTHGIEITEENLQSLLEPLINGKTLKPHSRTINLWPRSLDRNPLNLLKGALLSERRRRSS